MAKVKVESNKETYTGTGVGIAIGAGTQSLSNFSGGGVAPTELPATTPKAQRKRPPVLPKAAYGTGHSPSLILNHNPSMIVTTLRDTGYGPGPGLRWLPGYHVEL